jgi:predicted membrane GTPase involved in stress response
MKSYGIKAIRNVGLFGHQGGGKTSLAEAMLYSAGALERMGRTDDGSATTDFDPEEQRRRISINVALAPCEWLDTKINLVDVPGYLDFQGEVRGAMAAVEAAILVTPETCRARSSLTRWIARTPTMRRWFRHCGRAMAISLRPFNSPSARPKGSSGSLTSSR